MGTPTNEVSMPQLLAAFDGLGAQVCVLDAVGAVRWVNEPWRRFAVDNGLPHERGCDGSDCLGACRQLDSPDGDGPTRSLRQVIAGESAEFGCDHPCHSPTAQRWFHLAARGFSGEGGEHGTIVVRSDITAQVLAEEERAAIAKNPLHLQRLESLGNAARTIVHGFNNALTTLVGNLDLAKLHTLPSAPIQELLHEMTTAVDRCRTLARHLYELTQPRTL